MLQTLNPGATPAAPPETPFGLLLDTARAGNLNFLQAIAAAENLNQAGQPEQAIELYRAWLKKPNAPLHYVAYFNMGTLLGATGHYSEAEAAFRQAVYLKSDFFQAHYNLGVQMENQGRPQETLAQWRTALAHENILLPEHREIHQLLLNGLGRLLEKLHEYQEAEATLQRSLALNPEQQDALYHWIYLRQKQCQWPVIRALPGIPAQKAWRAASALAMLGLSDDPERLLEAARNYVSHNVLQTRRLVPETHRYPHRRIKLGFLSGDFCLHAVSLLTVGLYESLDREHFEVYGFGWSREDGTDLRKRVIAAFDKYFDIAALDDETAAHMIRAQEIDVVFDLQGLTAGARPNIVARGPAPIQIGYLGYPGSSAIPYVDYIVADDYILPLTARGGFTERPLYLPDCFQVADDRRTYTEAKTRQEYGLPAQGFIFCAFNNNPKITPEIFECWMHILRRVPDSLLWLLSDNPWAETNLRSACQSHGIDPERLYFAGRVAPSDYLSRFRAADLFLDTFPYNAGTTANDVLWVGLPLLTLSGRSYVSRMAGSLLRSVGLENLIATSYAEYENKAVHYATDPGLRRDCQQILSGAKTRSSALNTRKFALELGMALRKLVNTADRGASQ